MEDIVSLGPQFKKKKNNKEAIKSPSSALCKGHSLIAINYVNGKAFKIIVRLLTLMPLFSWYFKEP